MKTIALALAAALFATTAVSASAQETSAETYSGYTGFVSTKTRAEVKAELRLALQRGTARTIGLLAKALQQGVEDGSVVITQHPESLAQRLYALWLGTSVMSKITRTAAPFDEALGLTRQLLGQPGHTDAHTDNHTYRGTGK